jgi:hypothetical protein
MLVQERPDLAPAMDRPTIPEQVDRAAEVAQKVPEEGLDIEAGEIVGPTPEGRGPRAVAGATPPGRYQTERRSCR